MLLDQSDFQKFLNICFWKKGMF